MEALIKLIKQQVTLQIKQGTVTALQNDFCEVLLDDGSRKIHKVSLNAVLENGDDKLVLYPKVGSPVVLGVYEGSREGVILSFCDVEKIYYKKGATEAEVTAEGYKIEREGENLGKVVDDFMNTCQQIVVVQGNTIDQAAVIQQRQRLKKILKFN